MRDGRRIRLRGVFSAGAVRGGGMALTLLLNVVLVQLLGAEAYGIYSYGLSWALMVSLVGRIGLDQAAIRLLSTARHDGRHDEAAAIVPWALGIAVGLTLLLSLGLLVYASFDTTYGGALVIAAPLAVLMSVILTGQGILRSLTESPMALAGEFVGRPALTMLLVLGASVTGMVLTAGATLSLHLAAAAAIAALTLVMIPRAMTHELRAARRRFRSREWLAITLPIAWGNVLMMSEPQLVVILAGEVLSPEGVGWIAFAARLAAVLTFPLVAVNLFAAPRIARIYRSGDMALLQREVTLYCRMATIPIFVITIVFVGFLWAGGIAMIEETLAGSEPVIVLFAISRLVAGLTGPVGLLLMMTEHERIAARSATVSIAILLVVGFAGGYWLGPLGIAAGSMLALSYRSVHNLLIVRAKLGIWALPLHP